MPGPGFDDGATAAPACATGRPRTPVLSWDPQPRDHVVPGVRRPGRDFTTHPMRCRQSPRPGTPVSRSGSPTTSRRSPRARPAPRTTGTFARATHSAADPRRSRETRRCPGPRRSARRRPAGHRTELVGSDRLPRSPFPGTTTSTRIRPRRGSARSRTSRRRTTGSRSTTNRRSPGTSSTSRVVDQATYTAFEPSVPRGDPLLACPGPGLRGLRADLVVADGDL